MLCADLEHHDRVAAYHLFARQARRLGSIKNKAYHHPEPDLLSTGLLLYCIIQYNIQKDLASLSAMLHHQHGDRTCIVTSQDPNYFAATVQLHKQPLVEVLHVVSLRGAKFQSVEAHLFQFWLSLGHLGFWLLGLEYLFYEARSM